MTAERDSERKRGERGRKRAGWTSLFANLSESHVRWCAHPRARTEKERKRERKRREERAYACVCRALCTCIARWSAMADRPQLAKSALSYVQCENERGYRLHAKESAMRFINSLCDPHIEVDSSGFYEDGTSVSAIYFLF
ncbi:hypothetical protein ALC60_09772 [Trachymyrmex zeteki]|uniref:Uncharacterized protein n=1 Tax=Mycetomoellerius zeteki TaxID=64791 RepID=A0A151WU16_9HYME|nr:hypothetical protein ALC60_09772 [Trachymyrmex zeteki]